MLYHVLKKNIGTSIYSNILYKHNIVLSMYCILLLYNLPQIRKQYSTHLTTVPKIFVLILVISQRVAIFSNISKDLCGAFDFPFTCIFGYRFDLGEVMQSHKVMWDFYPLKPLKIYYTKNRGNLLKILLTAYLMCLIFDYWFKIRRN